MHTQDRYQNIKISKYTVWVCQHYTVHTPLVYIFTYTVHICIQRTSKCLSVNRVCPHYTCYIWYTHIYIYIIQWIQLVIYCVYIWLYTVLNTVFIWWYTLYMSSGNTSSDNPITENPLDMAEDFGIGLAMVALVSILQHLAIAKFYTGNHLFWSDLS